MTAGFLCICGVVFASEPSRVDLVLDKIKILPPRPNTRTAVEAAASVRNTGSESVSAAHMQAVLSRSGQRIASYDDIPVMSSLSRAASGISVPIKLGLLAPGEYELGMIISAPDEVIEENTDNNYLAVRFKVEAPITSETY